MTYTVLNNESAGGLPYVVFWTRDGKTERATHLGNRGTFKTLEEAKTAVHSAEKYATRLHIVQIIAESLFNYRDPPNSRFWGKERTFDQACVVFDAIRAGGWMFERLPSSEEDLRFQGKE